MSFAAPVFLWYFMPATLLVYWILPRRWRNGILAAASLIFYVWGAGAYVFLLLSCIAANFTAGLLLDSDRLAGSTRGRKSVLIGAIVWDLGALLIWKYAGFASHQINNLSKSLGLGGTHIIDLALPIGISFFTFHHMSYVIDVYRKDRPAQRNPLTFVTYIAMFPQLVAGPIVRYHEIADQFTEIRTNRLDDFTAGFPRFALGLAKKVIIADSVAPVASACFATPGSQLTTTTAWLGALAYTVQIFFDFSGYSDMALGLGRMFGFRLPENFNRPYSSVTITEFWRRWHMSLSRWFRDYVYIALGGNRRGRVRTYRNLVTIFVLCGFWHGANWTFLIWGLFHGALLVVERATGWAAEPTNRILFVIRRIITMFFVVIGWVFFNSSSLTQAMRIITHMLSPYGVGLPDAVHAALVHQRTLVLILALTVLLLPRTTVVGKFMEAGTGRVAWMTRFAVMAVAAPYAAILVAAGTFSPFLYYQF
ncbi:MAG TPA: MBOAT family protein [Mycobacteriales bacterium]|jgi:alginate O-acetyltransferase complex protein AlgI|nr:MBOAT family protein [Mycobacteriales bacterium]